MKLKDEIINELGEKLPKLSVRITVNNIGAIIAMLAESEKSASWRYELCIDRDTGIITLKPVKTEETEGVMENEK